MFPANTKTLVVDDMMTMRKIVSRCLKECGLTNVTEVDDGATAWPALELAAQTGKPFELVISDWNMPKMQGIELLKKVRSNPLTKSVPFIFITAEAEKDQVVAAIQLGASNYVTKPFTPATLREKLELVHALSLRKS